jgi:hypothetical protein
MKSRTAGSVSAAGAVAHDDARAHALAAVAVGHADDRDLDDVGMRGQVVLDASSRRGSRPCG